MDVKIGRIIGKFDSELDRRKPDHRVNVRDVTVEWLYRPDGSEPWRTEQLTLEAGESYDGATRPEIVGSLVPRFGVFTLADFVHDKCFRDRPPMSDGVRISRQHTDLLFYALMIHIAKERVTKGWKAKAQLLLARAMYTAVRWFGPDTWNRHDKEFVNVRKDPHV